MKKTGRSPWQIARRRFLANLLAVAGLVWLLICAFVAVFAYKLMPDDTTNANAQIIQLPKQPPGTRFTVILQTNKVMQPERGFFSHLLSGRPDNYLPIPTQARESIRLSNDTLQFIDHRGVQQQMLLPELLLPIDKYSAKALAWKNEGGKPYHLDGDQLQYADTSGHTQTLSLAGLTSVFWSQHVADKTFRLGSDAFGRDVLSRLLLGTRVSLGIGLMAMLLSLLFGLCLGALAGFFRGKADQVIMWFVSVVWSVPSLLLAIALAFVLGKGAWQLFLAIGASTWVDVARIVRGQIFSVREMQYVEAAKAMGFGSVRTIVRHILPNITSPLIIVATANFASAILLEAGLSFLGVGIQPPAPSWGSAIKDGYAQIMFDSGIWLAVFPGLAIILVVISLNLVGFGLRDALDPKYDQ